MYASWYGGFGVLEEDWLVGHGSINDLFGGHRSVWIEDQRGHVRIWNVLLQDAYPLVDLFFGSIARDGQPNQSN